MKNLIEITAISFILLGIATLFLAFRIDEIAKKIINLIKKNKDE